jgi:hypothetical protein
VHPDIDTDDVTWSCNPVAPGSLGKPVQISFAVSADFTIAFSFPTAAVEALLSYAAAGFTKGVKPPELKALGRTVND